MKQFQIISQLVNDLTPIATTENCSSSPGMGVDSLCGGSSAKLAGVSDLQEHRC